MQLTEVPYPNRFHADTTAVALTYRAALAGHRGPGFEGPFSYCDIGCGSGVTLTALASIHPQAEFIGLDLSARHIETACRLAADCGLENVRFLQRDIDEADALPNRSFDFIVVHGLLSWVPPATAQRILATAAKRLAPGGLLFLSYNRSPEAERIAPIRRYLKRFAAARPGLSPVEAVEAAIDHWRSKEGEIFPADSAQNRFLAYLAQVPAAGLAHEFLGDHWHAWSSDALHRRLEELGLALVSEGPVPASDDGPFPILCRRDLFGKSGNGGDEPGALTEMKFCLSGHSGIAPYSIWTEGQRLGLPEGVLRELRQRIEQGCLHAADHEVPARETIACLVGHGVLAPCVGGQPGGPNHCRPPVRIVLALNRVLLARDLGLGADLVVSPVTGTAVSLLPLERLILDALQGDRPEAACREAIVRGDVALSEFHNVGSMTDRQLDELITGCIESFVAARLPILARLGICEDG